MISTVGLSVRDSHGGILLLGLLFGSRHVTHELTQKIVDSLLFVKQFRNSVSYFTKALIDISHLSGKNVELSLLKMAD